MGPWTLGIGAPFALGAALSAARGLKADWATAVPLHVREVTGIASRVADALFWRLAEGEVSCVTLL
jgi:hypothetical protein